MKPRHFHQIVAAFLSLFVTSNAQAETAIDCNAVKTTSIPVELTYRHRGIKESVQVFRGAPGDDVVWTQKKIGQILFLTRTVLTDGRISEFARRAPSGELGRSKWNHDGLPKNFDYRDSLNYKSTEAYSQGTTWTYQNSYRFKSEGRIDVGPCNLTVVRGDNETTTSSSQAASATNTKSHSAITYLPELRLVISEQDFELAFDDIKTSFTPLTLDALTQPPPYRSKAYPLASAPHPCFLKPTQDCLLAEAAAVARSGGGIGGILGSLAVSDMANVARALAKLGRKEQADRMFAEADALAKRRGDLSDSVQVVRGLFDAGRVDEAMLRSKTVKGPGIAEAAIDALIAAGRPTEAESFLASAQSWNVNTERGKLTEAYLAAGLTDKALGLLKEMTEPYRTAILKSAAYNAEKAGRAEVVAALLASLPDDTARQAVRQTLLQYSSGARSAKEFSSALEKGNFDEAMNILARPEMTSTRPGALASAAAAACKAGKRELARKFDNDLDAALATEKASPGYLSLTIRRAVIAAQCKEDQLATATFAEARKYIDGQPKQPYLSGMLAQGYLTAGNIQAAIETARLTNDQSTMKRLLSAMAKAGHVRESLEYIDKEVNFGLSEMLVAVAENMPSGAVP